MAATATIMVNFGSDSAENIHLSAELDSDKNNGKSSFQAGDVVYFKVYCNVNYTVTQTSGATSKLGTLNESGLQENVAFVNTDVGRVPKRIMAVESYEWYGTSLGAITPYSHSEVKASGAGTGKIGVAKVTYQSVYDSWQLTPPAGMPETYAIVILVTAGG